MRTRDRMLSVVFFVLSLGPWVTAGAHGRIPNDMRSLEPGKVIRVMETDFLVPSGFRMLPGPMFYLAHAKALGLGVRQQEEIRRIAERIMPETVRAGRRIDRLKSEVITLGDARNSFPSPRVHFLLRRIGLLEAEANFQHIEAHRACLDLLDPRQKARLFSLLSHH
ncbi:hypothetical protein BOX30_09545 [Leptospirillum ferriphilum]|uniref:Uncharacterized protein n=2 Tax=Leptospirillum ferriphilum TaxID=178606 RepID=A0A059XTB6_9BACT|nr:hypothetical protein [Leptospirillum ferriphilum]AIA31849.1 hypothetical protein Y981_08905 [Leptospirillum ferriphilum YSK]OOH77678.1 hypothetical protein BOX30_09545 [Leptospirillum ferriphilum]